MPRTDILVLDGEAFLALKVVRVLAQAKRWRIHVLAKATESPRPFIEWSRHVSVFHQVVAGDESEYLREVERMVRRVKAKVILPVTESGVLFCIRHRDALERITAVPSLPTEEMFTTAIDKGRLAAFMAEHGVPHPKTLPGSAASFEELQCPLLVKPHRERNGWGIVRVESLAELHAELDRRKSANDFCVQEVVEGSDWGCSALAKDGEILAWTTQRGLRRKGRFSTFDELQIEVSEPVREVVARLIRALKWSGVANLDLRISARTGEALVLEVNGRFWASLAASMLAGTNFADLAAQHTLGAYNNRSDQRSRDVRFVHANAWVRTVLRNRGVRKIRSDLLLVISDPLPQIMSRLKTRHRMFRSATTTPLQSVAPSVI